MKKLLGLVLAGCLAFGSSNLYSQDFKFPHETDKYKFIPEGTFSVQVLKRTDHGILMGVWYNKDCKNLEDYNKLLEKIERIPEDEFFLDYDNDGIMDFSLKGLNKLIDEYILKTKLEKTSL